MYGIVLAGRSVCDTLEQGVTNRSDDSDSEEETGGDRPAELEHVLRQGDMQILEREEMLRGEKIKARKARNAQAKRKGAPRFGSCSVWELHSKSFCWCRSSATCAVCCC